jgi:hypothetical protein
MAQLGGREPEDGSDTLATAQIRWQGTAPRQRFLRFHAVLSALLTPPFLLSVLMLLVFLGPILTLESCILILLRCPSHPCTI